MNNSTSNKKFSYKNSGVDISLANETKQAFKKNLYTDDKRVLNQLGAFASLYDGKFSEYKHPVLVMKSEEPGSKQKLAFQYEEYESIAYDMINHLINDVIVMGAKPLFAQDVIICGKLDKSIAKILVSAMAEACRKQECTLIGGETSEQPGVLEPGLYVLASSLVGVVDKSAVINGSRICQGDLVLALPSNGLHTNGYSLVRALINENVKILDETIDNNSFIDVILKPHYCYYQDIKELFSNPGLTGMAHITGGGIAENLNRILPSNMNARIDLSKINILPVFKLIRQYGNVEDSDMLRTFNLGVGLTMVIRKEILNSVQKHLEKRGLNAYIIGEIIDGAQQVEWENSVNW